MQPSNDLKFQRDRFLAFSFAGADLLIEINPTGHITFAAGATHAILGADDKDILNTDFATFFSDDDKELINIIQKHTKVATKQGPYLVTIRPADDTSKHRHVFLSSFKMLPHGPTSVAISLGDDLLKTMKFERRAGDVAHIANPEEFENLLQKKIPAMLAKHEDTHVQLLQLPGVETYKTKMGSDNWVNFMASIGQTIMEFSKDGESAVQIENGKYLLLKDSQSNAEELLNQKLMSLAKDYNIGDSLNIESKNIQADADTLTAKETTRAILYTIKKMESGGIDNCGDDLRETFGAYLQENSKKISDLKRIISHQEFAIHFQPIVDLKTEMISHHEVLVRFEKQASPFELITLGEEVGIASDIDLSICRQSLKYADIHAARNIGKLAVNISGASIHNDIFVDKLLSTLKQYPKAAQNLIFEITESSEIKELDKVNTLIQHLRKNGHAVCLDDFGAGAASFQYLHKLHVDGIKIDGSYVKTLLTSPRDATMVRNITKMCHELDIYVVAEMIETREQSNYLLDLGVDKGQGWLFAKAALDTLPLDKKIGS